jgi:ABC-type uncharacterized transport system substrate-binding protein
LAKTVGVGGSPAILDPSVAPAEQPAMPVIGFLETRSPDMISDRLRRFRQGLKDTGYVEGENVTIVYDWAESFDRLSALAAELVRRPFAVIVTPTTPAAIAAKAATTTVPIVFATGYDPVASGLVASLARPGRNLTGVNFFNNELAAKQLELLRELVPGAAHVSALVNPSNVRNASVALADLETAARARGMQIQVLNASTNREIDDAFATFLRQRPDALITVVRTLPIEPSVITNFAVASSLGASNGHAPLDDSHPWRHRFVPRPSFQCGRSTEIWSGRSDGFPPISIRRAVLRRTQGSSAQGRFRHAGYGSN